MHKFQAARLYLNNYSDTSHPLNNQKGFLTCHEECFSTSTLALSHTQYRSRPPLSWCVNTQMWCTHEHKLNMCATQTEHVPLFFAASSVNVFPLVTHLPCFFLSLHEGHRTDCLPVWFHHILTVPVIITVALHPYRHP